MADALCGPANPLQQFKQQTGLDRTLQQDRLSSRASPAQGFRSPDPNAGLLDPEFEAFQAGVAPLDLPSHQPFHPQQPSFAGASQAPSWATDFQRMHISPPPSQQQRAFQSGPATAGWAQGFRDQIRQSTPVVQHRATQSPLEFQQRARLGYNGFQSGFTPQSTNAPNIQSSKGKEPVHEQFDEAAFERAFAQAADDVMADLETADSEDVQDVVLQQHQQVRDFADEQMLYQQINAEQSANEIEAHFRAPELMQDVVEPIQEERTEEQKQQEEQDALAATAQELLEKVQNNQTDKFRNSQFLGLMRKIRDREVKVEGDKMIETAASTTSDTSLNKSSATTAPLFDNSEQRPSPLAASTTAPVVDTRPPDYGLGTDEDLGRVEPKDGQAVVDLLNQREEAGDDIGTFRPRPLSIEGEPPYYGDLRTGHSPRFDSEGESASLIDMLYGANGSLEH